MKDRKCTDDEIRKAVEESESFIEALGKLGQGTNGSDYKWLKQQIFRLEIDFSHHSGQKWAKGKRLKSLKKYKKNGFYKYLKEDRGNRCEDCGNDTWKDSPIPLEIHHIDGNNQNNDLDNLRVLCPNCHAFTPNYRGRGIKKKTKEITNEEIIAAADRSVNIREFLMELELTPKGGNYETARKRLAQVGRSDEFENSRKKHFCCVCGIEVNTNRKYCSVDCRRLKSYTPPRKFNPTKEQLEILIKEYPMTTIGKMFGVTDNAVRKRCKYLGIDLTESYSQKYSAGLLPPEAYRTKESGSIDTA